MQASLIPALAKAVKQQGAAFFLPNKLQQQRDIQLRRNGEHRLRNAVLLLPPHHNRTRRGSQHCNTGRRGLFTSELLSFQSCCAENLHLYWNVTTSEFSQHIFSLHLGSAPPGPWLCRIWSFVPVHLQQERFAGEHFQSQETIHVDKTV